MAGSLLSRGPERFRGPAADYKGQLACQCARRAETAVAGLEWAYSATRERGLVVSFERPSEPVLEISYAG